MSNAKTPTKAHASSTGSSKTAGAHTTAHRKAEGTPNAIELLTDDHKEVKKLFTAYDKLVKDEASSKEKQTLAHQICTMLTVHTTIEEEIFYPAARAALAQQDLLDEATVEHASAKELISQIESMEPGDDLYDAKVTVLGEYIDHHVKEEETEMFPKARKAKMPLEELGEDMAARKQELVAASGNRPRH